MVYKHAGHFPPLQIWICSSNAELATSALVLSGDDLGLWEACAKKIGRLGRDGLRFWVGWGVGEGA